jgi:transposase
VENRNLHLAARVTRHLAAPVVGPVAGVDLGDRKSEVCVYAQGVILERFQFEMTIEGVRAAFAGKGYARIAMEAGAQSPWVTRELRELGYEPLVANTRKLKAISANERKSDRNDALLLARLAAADASLLYPIHHRSAERADALAVLKARNAAVVGRARLINTIRALAKSMGFRYKRTTAEGFARQEVQTPSALAPAVAPLFSLVRSFNEQVKAYDAQLEEMAERHFPETRHLLQVHGVGPVTALAYVLVIEDPMRFPNGRTAAAYLGLVPRRDQSGTSDKQLGISKTGNTFVRRLLVQCAQYILGPHGQDCDLRRWGHKLADRGGKNAKKRAIVATARRLAVLLFRLWKCGEVWQPLFNASAELTRSTPPETVSEGLPDTAVFDDCAGPLDAVPAGRNVAREIAASTTVRTPPCTGPREAHPTSADRSKDPGKPSKKSTKAPVGARAKNRPSGSVPATAAPSAPAAPACAGDPADACTPPARAVRGADVGAGQGPSPVRRAKARSSR